MKPTIIFDPDAFSNLYSRKHLDGGEESKVTSETPSIPNTSHLSRQTLHAKSNPISLLNSPKKGTTISDFMVKGRATAIPSAFSST